MSKTKVLYVEDEVFLGKIVKESLESRGFEVIMESDGAKATGVFKKSEPDICVLDVMLPNKDGFTIADEIREQNEEVPIICFERRRDTHGRDMGRHPWRDSRHWSCFCHGLRWSRLRPKA